MTKKELETIKWAVDVLELYESNDPEHPIKVLVPLKALLTKNDTRVIKEIQETEPQRFVRLFAEVYLQCSGHHYKVDTKTYILAYKLIKAYGYNVVQTKAKLLAFYCRDGRQWFVRDSWASFTIETLSARWNNILPIKALTPEEIKDKKYQDEVKKWEEHDAAINQAIIRTGTPSDSHGVGTVACAAGQAFS